MTGALKPDGVVSALLASPAELAPKQRFQ
jgi:hypothetical protein